MTQDDFTGGRMSETRVKGTVVRQHRSHFVVEGDDGTEYLCGVSSKLRKTLEYPEADRASLRRRVQNVAEITATSPVVVGDRVEVELGDETHLIMAVGPRQSILSRESPGKRNVQQVIAANIDQVLAVTSVQAPPFNADLLNRVLVGAEFQGIASIICMTKIDLGIPDAVRKALEGYPNEYPVLYTSAETGEGLDQLTESLRSRNSVAIGLSGVGKTSLINAIEPDLNLRVQPVNRKTGKGRHTTTHSELVRLSNGGHLVDAPGLRELSLWSAEPEDIEQLFPDFTPYRGKCRFGSSCVHDQEPGCAIKEAVEGNSIAAHRYETYLTLWKQAEQAASDYRDRRRPRPTE